MKDNVIQAVKGLLLLIAFLLSHLIAGAIGFSVQQQYISSESSYQGYKEGSEYMAQMCYDLIDYSNGHSPTLRNEK